MRTILDPQLRSRVGGRDGGRCYVCKYPFAGALVVHHEIPVEWGGRDTLGNLRLLCHNCHALAHAVSQKSGPPRGLERGFPKYGSYTRLRRLGIKIRQARDGKYTTDGRAWRATKNTRPQYSLLDAAVEVAGRNKSDPGPLQKVILRVVKNIPTPVKRKCSARLIRNGRCLSINVMNYLLFRTPALPDMAHTSEKNRYCFLIWPSHSRPFGWQRSSKNRIGFTFAAIEAVSIVLSLDEVLALKPKDWRAFQRACSLALHGPRTRDWPANVKIS
jgi:hypothetical protein